MTPATEKAAPIPAEMLREFVQFVKHAPVSSGTCCCGDEMDRHSDPMSCGHSPVDMWDHALDGWLKQIEPLLADRASQEERIREDERLRLEGDLDRWMKTLGAGITGYQPEAYAVMDAACAELVRARARIAALEAEASEGQRWQPIGTAPRDGREVILHDRGTVGTGFYSEAPEARRAEAGWFWEDDRGNLLIAKNADPTHWMPLPSPPQDREEQ